jgi:CheY-like chemotaxis protein
MGGTIGFGTQPGVGTTFHFTIQAPLMPAPQSLPEDSLSSDDGVAPQRKGELDAEDPLASYLPLKILIVDDLSVNQKVAVKMLERLGYAPDCVADGLTALDRVQHQIVGLVLMDVQMPGMDGYETTELIRQLPSVTAEQPWIVAMTAHPNQQDRQRSLQIGMNDFLSKPILLTSLAECLVRFGRTHCPDKIPPVALPDGRQSPPVLRSPALPLLDRAMIDGIRTMAGSEANALLAELIANYREDANRCLQQLHQAIHHQNGDQIRHQAHALRSMSLNLGALSLGSLCQDLELHHARLSPEDQKTSLAEIEHLYAEVMVTLKSEIVAHPQSEHDLP